MLDQYWEYAGTRYRHKFKAFEASCGDFTNITYNLFKHNHFEIISNGDYVICAVSKKKIPLENLNYWNVELQEAYFSPVEVKIKQGQLKGE